MDLGLLGSEDGSSGFSGVSGRETVSEKGGRDGESCPPYPRGLIVDRRREPWGPSESSDSCDGLLMGCPSPGIERGELAASSDRDKVSPRLCTPYILSLGSVGSPEGESGSSSEACGLRERKKVAGTAVRGSRDGECSRDVLRAKVCRSGTGRMVKTSRLLKDLKKVCIKEIRAAISRGSLSCCVCKPSRAGSRVWKRRQQYHSIS